MTGFTNKRGSIDQTIASVVVFFAVVFLMGVFVIVSSNIGSVLGLFDTDSRYVGDETFLVAEQLQVSVDLFLTEQIIVGDREALVVDALQALAKGERFFDMDRGETIGIVEQVFEERYSCDGENILLFGIYDRGGSDDGGNDLSSYENVIRYIEKEGDYSGVARSGTQTSDGFSTAATPYPQHILGYVDGYYTAVVPGVVNGRITIQENRRC